MEIFTKKFWSDYYNNGKIEQFFHFSFGMCMRNLDKKLHFNTGVKK